MSPGKLPTGTLRAVLEAIGWRLERAGRIHARGVDRGALTYRAARVALPDGVNPEALAAAWLAELLTPVEARFTRPPDSPPPPLRQLAL